MKRMQSGGFSPPVGWEPESIIITGISGSGGSYLSEYIAKNHPTVQIHGIARWHSSRRVQSATTQGAVIHEADLMDFASVLRVLGEVKPDIIFHLAAHANVAASFVTPNTVLSNNIIGTSNLLEAVIASGLDPIVQICSTSEVYGQVDPNKVPIDEDTPLRPVSPYAVSKAAQDLLGRAYYVSRGMHIIRTRMFAYLNPRRIDLFATSFAKQVAWIERGLQKELSHGNLDSIRTLIDVHDAMRAYWLAVFYCQAGEEYNIGGNTTMKVGELLERLIALSDTPIPTRCDPRLLRPADVTLQIPCVEKFVTATGWRPEIDFDDSLKNLLEYWRLQADLAVYERSKRAE